MAKDKDDDADEETVPVILATMRSNIPERGPPPRPIAPMYGRPMPRPQIMRPPIRPPMVSYGHPQARMESSVPHRMYAAPAMPQRPPMRPLPPYQPVLVMLAHVPMPIQVAESRMGPAPVSVSPYYSSHHPNMYPQVPYAVPMG